MMSLDTQNRELIVRKRKAQFIEKALQFCGYDFRHDDYKHVVYAESGYKTQSEEKAKNLYDAYSFLLSNAQNPFSASMLKRFFYILTGKETDEALIIRMITRFFEGIDMPPLEKAIEYHLYVFSELQWLSSEEILIVPLMFFNFVLVKGGIPTIYFVQPVLRRYVECRKAYFDGDKTQIYEFFLGELRVAKFQDKSFYKKLKPLTTKEICDRFLEDKELLQSRYGVESICIFGSFSKEIQRLDSDIDLLITFSQDLSYEQKNQLKTDLSNRYFDIFNRYIDITEISEYVNDWIVKEITIYKKIF